VTRPTNEQIGAWYPRLFRTALRLTGSHDDASDLTQQAFLKALGGWESFDGRSLPTTWLHRILVNCVTDWRRKLSSGPSQAIDEWALVLADGDSTGRRQDMQEPMQHLRQAIEELPVALRSAFVATVVDGYTYEEAAGVLKVPVGTIGSRVHEARKQLRTVMQRDFPEGIS
jgi:RNA polymerase sigma-70 factor (ECF subfamily)